MHIWRYLLTRNLGIVKTYEYCTSVTYCRTTKINYSRLSGRRPTFHRQWNKAVRPTAYVLKGLKKKKKKSVNAFLSCQCTVSSLCCTDRTLHAGLDDLLRGAQIYVVDDPDKLVHAAAQGHLDVVRDVVRKHPCKVRADYWWLSLIRYNL